VTRTRLRDIGLRMGITGTQRPHRSGAPLMQDSKLMQDSNATALRDVGSRCSGRAS
jgi:hypothetical protein